MRTLSVLLCTYNRHELLATALQSLVSGSKQKPDQVVIVNGGDQRADQVVHAYQKQVSFELKLVKTTNVNLATSRNVGLKHCTGDIVAMTDDDAQVFPDWITLMQAVHAAHPEAGAVGGPVVGTNTHSLVGKVADLVTFPAWPEPRYVRTLPGVNISYKRDIIEQVGEQDVALFRGEDVDFNWRIKQLGYEIYFDPRIKVYHHHRPTLRALLNQHYMYGRAYYLVRQKWPDMYCVYPHGIKRLRDILKLGNFFLAPAYQPLLSGRGMNSVRDRVLALPIMVGVEVMWRSGMLVQMFKHKESR